MRLNQRENRRDLFAYLLRTALTALSVDVTLRCSPTNTPNANETEQARFFNFHAVQNKFLQ